MLAIVIALAAADVPATTQPADSLDKVRCVREEVIGSLVQTRKVCHTQREWQRIRRDGHDEAERIIQPGNLNDLNN